MNITKEEAEIIRQWFDAVQDLNPAYLTGKDYDLAELIYLTAGVRVPESIVLRGKKYNISKDSPAHECT